MALLGKLPDVEVAKQLGRQNRDMAAKRNSLDIPYMARHVRRWTELEEKLMGTAAAEVIARELNRSIMAVQQHRDELRIPVFGMREFRSR